MKIGIFGSGMIVKNALKTIESIDGIKCTALWCRDVDLSGAKDLQDKYGINNIYNDMKSFLADDSYDVAYIGVINSLHYELTKKALEAKKHVICEKPFTSNGKEARELLSLAQDNNLMLFEAIMLRYANNYDEIRKRIDELGSIKMVQCNYSQYSSRYDKYLEGVVLPAFEPKLSGGCLYDINIYCIHFTIGLFGKPNHVNYFPNIGFNGIDTSGILVLDYGEFKAICMGAKDSNSKPFVSIQGDKGYIHMDEMPGVMQNIDLVLNKKNSLRIDIEKFDDPMKNEFEKIKEMIAKKEYKKIYDYMENSIIVMETVEEARKQAGIRFDSDIN